MAMGQSGMADMGDTGGTTSGPPNTIPMTGGTGPFGPVEMGGMFTVVKVRDDLAVGDYRDPGWYPNPKGRVTRRVSTDPSFGSPPRGKPTAPSASSPKSPEQMPGMPDMPGMKHRG
jgi:hypothetical protein